MSYMQMTYNVIRYQHILLNLTPNITDKYSKLWQIVLIFTNVNYNICEQTFWENKGYSSTQTVCHRLIWTRSSNNNALLFYHKLF